jgi:hypothetical protein
MILYQLEPIWIVNNEIVCRTLSESGLMKISASMAETTAVNNVGPLSRLLELCSDREPEVI